MKDMSINQRMKTYYEHAYRILLPKKTYYIIRIDGKAFHTYTRGLKRPFDDELIKDMDETALYLCEKIQGCKFAYVQSDEISLMLTDLDDIKTQAWFQGNIQKIVSVSSSMATAKFNKLRPGRLAFFDSRVFVIPTIDEVINYFIARQMDCTRNSIQLVAQSLYSPKQLHKKTNSDLQEMIHLKGLNWNNYTVRQKRGGLITKLEGKWSFLETPIFTQEKDIFFNIIPQ